jgi:SAM-dependent methyltransferase
VTSLPALYRDPELYDLIHADGTADEVWLLDRIAEKHGNGGKTALEPACGTGRYLAGLARRGWHVAGYDISTEMVRYSRRRLARWGKRAFVERGEMTTYRSQRRYDLALNALSTFRHLTTPICGRRMRC